MTTVGFFSEGPSLQRRPHESPDPAEARVGAVPQFPQIMKIQALRLLGSYSEGEEALGPALEGLGLESARGFSE